MSDSQRDHLAWRLELLESAYKKDQQTIQTLGKIADTSRVRLKDLEREISNLRRLAEEAKEKAELVAKTLDLKEQEAAAEAMARSLVAKWLQILLGAVVLLVTLWSSKWVNAIDQIKAMLGLIR